MYFLGHVASGKLDKITTDLSMLFDGPILVVDVFNVIDVLIMQIDTYYIPN